MKKLQIFVSSTFTDLKQERQAAVMAILKAGHIPAGMELFTAGDESQLEVIYKWIDESDAYILILGGRYGSVERRTRKSYVELEYDYAGTKNKPRCAIVMSSERLSELRALNPNDPDRLEQKHTDEYALFRDSLVQNKLCAFFSDHKDVTAEIQHKIMKWQEDPKAFVGWVRGSDVEEPKQALLNQLMETQATEARLRELTEMLRKQVELQTIDLQVEHAQRGAEKGALENAAQAYSNIVLRYQEAQAKLDKLASAKRVADILMHVDIRHAPGLGTHFWFWNSHKNSLGYVFAKAGDRFINGFNRLFDAQARVLDKYACTKLELYGVVRNEGGLWKATELGKEVLKILHTVL